MADQIEDALIREINDDLREEQMMQLWRRFGGYVIGVAVLVVVIVAGYQGWKHYTTTASHEDGERFYAASQMARSGNHAAAIEAFQKLAAEAGTGYGVLALFQEASLKVQTGDTAAAKALYLQIAKDNAADPAVSGLANVLGALVELKTGGYDRANLEMRLNAIAVEGQPYRYSARELLGLVALDAGDIANARALFEQLAADTTAPQAMSQRAHDIAQSLSANQ